MRTLVLFCPKCGFRHVDEGEWATREHRTHLCARCGDTWRPHDFPTVGAPRISCTAGQIVRVLGGTYPAVVREVVPSPNVGQRMVRVRVATGPHAAGTGMLVTWEDLVATYGCPETEDLLS